MLIINDLSLRIAGRLLLDHASVTLPAGSKAGLVGRNGTGKTTLFKAISGTVAPAGGKILFDGRDLLAVPPPPRAHLGIAHVPEGRGTFAELTVWENLRLGAYTRRRTSKDDYAQMQQYFPVLAQRRRNKAGVLSGGEQQMLACARALMTDPQLLLMDEPSEGLAPQKLRELGALLDQLRASGIAILLIEQNMRFALRYCNGVYVMDQGEIGFAGTPDALMQDAAAQERLLGVGSVRSPAALSAVQSKS